MILAAGCFDGLSAPQVRYLQAARQIDRSLTLMVTVVPDSYILKAKGRLPYWPQSDRVHAVYALGCVDDVHTQGEGQSVPDVIRLYRPRYFVKGPEWQDTLDADHVQACRDVEAEIVFTRNYGKHWSQVR